MYCTKCGAPLKNSAHFCSMCGEPVLSGYDSFEKQPDAGRRQIYTYENQAPMKWFKFVIWVQLLLSAFVLWENAVCYLSGIYGKIYIECYASYSYFRWSRPLEIVIDVIYFFLALAAIYIRFQLSEFKRMAPRLYIYLLIANMVLQTLQLIIFPLSPLSPLVVIITIIVMVVVNGPVIALNIIYFRKRKHLFVN